METDDAAVEPDLASSSEMGMEEVLVRNQASLELWALISERSLTLSPGFSFTASKTSDAPKAASSRVVGRTRARTSSTYWRMISSFSTRSARSA